MRAMKLKEPVALEAAAKSRVSARRMRRTQASNRPAPRTRWRRG
jgi:hypothetical protein